MAALVVLSLGLPATWYFGKRSNVAVAPHDPVSVLVADFTNNTKDAVFEGLIEQAMMVGVEGASFVTACPRRDAQRLASQIAQVDRLDAGTASLVALREGVARVVTGSIELAAPRYRLTVNLVDPNGSKVLQTWKAEAPSRDAVLETVSELAAQVREGLGDVTAASTRAPAEESFTAASLDAARARTRAGRNTCGPASTKRPMRPTKRRWSSTRTLAAPTRGWAPCRRASDDGRTRRRTSSRHWRASAA